jgi:hypothetical protein
MHRHTHNHKKQRSWLKNLSHHYWGSHPHFPGYGRFEEVLIGTVHVQYIYIYVYHIYRESSCLKSSQYLISASSFADEFLLEVSSLSLFVHV